jgi:hypothetical protein
MDSISESKLERIITSFVSLFSSVLTVEGGKEVEMSKDSSEMLSRFVSPSVRVDDLCLRIPSLLLKNRSGSGSGGQSLEEAAALNLARSVALTLKELSRAPLALLSNISESFVTLLDSRRRSSIQALIRQSHHQKDSTLTRVIVGLLACSKSPISPSTIVTSFRTLPACELTQGGELVVPLIMECLIDLQIFGNLVTVTCVAPGTIQTTIGSDLMICKAEIILDTLSFLHSMMKQARLAVRKTVAFASVMGSNLLMPSSLPNNHESSTKDENPIPKAVLSSLNFHDEAVKDETESSSLMPPPPSRPSKRSLSEFSHYDNSEKSGNYNYFQNASWGDSQNHSKVVVSGLSLLTAAAGLEPDVNNSSLSQGSMKDIKRQRTAVKR